jgi:hypothetical protein
MGLIYSHAKVVVSWLGAEPETEAAVRTIMRIGTELENHKAEDGTFAADWIEKHPDLCRINDGPAAIYKPTGNPIWDRLRAFAMCRYFSRVWVIQEIVLPRALVFLCGTSSVGPKALYNLIKWKNELKRSKPPKPRLVDPRIWTWLCGPYFWSPLDDWEENVWELRQCHLSWPDKACIPWGRIWEYTLRSESTEAKDMIYAFLSLSDYDIQVDYGKHVAEVYCDYFRHVLEKTRSLSLLGLAGIGLLYKSNTQTQLPSWCPGFWSLDTQGILEAMDGPRPTHGPYLA